MQIFFTYKFLFISAVTWVVLVYRVKFNNFINLPSYTALSHLSIQHLWGVLKDRVYASKPRTVEDLKEEIQAAVGTVSQELCAKVCRSVPSRLQKCLDVGGAQTELFWESFVRVNKTRISALQNNIKILLVCWIIKKLWLIKIGGLHI